LSPEQPIPSIPIVPSGGGVKVDFVEVHEISNQLTSQFMENDVRPPVAGAALCLCLGRMLMPDSRRGDGDAEVEFVQNMVAWAGAYWLEGRMN